MNNALINFNEKLLEFVKKASEPFTYRDLAYMGKKQAVNDFFKAEGYKLSGMFNG